MDEGHSASSKLGIIINLDYSEVTKCDMYDDMYGPIIISLLLI